MSSPPPNSRRTCPAGFYVAKIQQMPIHFYRYLYDIVGSPWVWWERKQQTDGHILQELHSPGYEVFVAYQDHVPAGLAELDWRVPGKVQLNYFGLVPDFVGRGLGGYFLDWTVAHVYSDGGQRRYWVHTCSFDSPAAVPCYKSAGFTQYDEVRTWMTDPR